MLKTLNFVNRSSNIISCMNKRAFSTHATKDTFENLVIKSSRPTVVDFYADWCPPCKALEPVLEKTISEYGKADLIKVNVDNESELAERFRITGIPRVIGFKNGKEIFAFSGAINSQAIKNELSKFDK